MFLAKELGKSLEEMLEISTLELVLWAAYYGLEKKDSEKRMRANNGRKHSR